MDKMPAWADAVLVPLISLILAAAISSIVILAIGENPIEALNYMIEGALLSSAGWGQVLYYATNYIFTGLAVAIASHARLFNIGGEGQAQLGGLGVALLCLFIPFPHWTIAFVFAIIAAGLFGAAWAYIPALLQAKRDSHIVITTIMFNYIAYALLNYMLVNVLRPEGAMEPASGNFPGNIHLPTFQEMFSYGDTVLFRSAPANVSFFLAVIACIGIWLLIWRTRLGYEIRAFGQSDSAAKYAGINPARITIIAMLISGALAGMMALNTTMGYSERLVLNASEGAGFIGIAVALMGRNHPIGIFFAALLFGFLVQGGTELSFWTSIPTELVVVIQALVILFTGALDNMIRMPLVKLFALGKGGR